ncbi:ABC1 kinase family protein [Longivirga aurantiaca]|uniref:ABC1 kinase family protein n=1 Tax=Longivirga aurantiaca TaxID=1837743 RepID=A0ABW1T0A8_9ACTN
MAPATTSVIRSARIAALVAALTARSAVTAVRARVDPDPARLRREARAANAEALRSTLGGMKGGALKAGQLLSTVDSLFPPDPDRTWTEALTSLQESNPPLAWNEVEPLLHQGLGGRWRERLVEVDEDAAAAASLGQVHRGTWCDGRAVAVKVQYPFARQALMSDLGALSMSLRVAGAVLPGLVAAPLVDELRVRAAEELDYVHEATAQRAVATAFAGSEEFAVPDVVEVGGGVLVSEWLEGRPLVSAVDDADLDRARIAERYQRFALLAPALSGWLHADPHPGNFRITPDGRLGVLDFGAVVPMPDGLPTAFGRLVHTFADETDDASALDALREFGLVRAGRTVDVASLRSVMSPFGEPARHDTFHFSPEWLRACFARDDAARDPDYTAALGLDVPAEHLMTQRVWLGLIGVLCRLDVTVPVRPVLAELLPGFQAAR